MLSILSSTKIHRRRPGMSHLQMEWLYLELMLKEAPDQSILPKIATPRSSLMIKETMPSILSSTKTLRRRPGTSHLLMEWLYLEPMLKEAPDQSTQLRIATLKFSPMNRETMPSMMSNITTLPRKLGMNLHQMECHLLVLMLKRATSQSTQLRIVTLKFFHTNKETMLSTMNNISTPPKRPGMNLVQMACLCQELMLNSSGPRIQSTQPRIAILKFFHTNKEIMLSMMSSTLTLLKKLGTSLLLQVCHWLVPMPKKVNFSS
jgi:hypothetical protein